MVRELTEAQKRGVKVSTRNQAERVPHKYQMERLKEKNRLLKASLDSGLAHLSKDLDIGSYGLEPRQALFLWKLWVEMDRYRGDEMEVMKDVGVTWSEVRRWEEDEGYKRLRLDLQRAHFDTMGRRAAYEIERYFDRYKIDQHSGKTTNQRVLAPRWVVEMCLRMSGVDIGSVPRERRPGLAEEMARHGIDEMVLAMRRGGKVGQAIEGSGSEAGGCSREVSADFVRVSSVCSELSDDQGQEASDGSVSVEQGAEVLEESVDGS